jgi:nucleoid-associated protein YgaU
MGFVEFIKDAGERAMQADAIRTKIEAELPNAFGDLRVELRDGVVSLFGVCDDTPTREKAVLIAGNVSGVGRVNFDGITVRKPTADVEFYTIVKGDNLSKIAKKFYGDAGKYPLIFEANKGIIKNASLIYPGQVIRIPQLDGTGDKPVADKKRTMDEKRM